MGCPDLEGLERLAAGSTSEAEAAELDVHLSSCASCRSELERVESNVQTVSTLRSLHRADLLPESVTDGAPVEIGSYRVLEEVGRGGMGVVYRALQERPHREVALKVVHPGFASARSLRRFELEVEGLGRLEHPGIAHIYAAGTADVWGERRPYFAMEYIRGRRLPDYCTEEGLDWDQKLALFAHVCEGVHHAHLRGVIHRDLKPGNILVTNEGEPKVIDFGLARVSDPNLGGISAHTEVGHILGTLPFMAPEQFGGDPELLDGRADVYGLGAVLFHLLCGRPPLVVEGMSLPSAALFITENSPPPPSSLDSSLPRELDWICACALEKEPERRYSSVAQLADDLRRFRLHQPMHAGPPSRAYRLSLFVRRHAVGVTVSAITVVALLFGLFSAMRAAEVARDSAVQEREGREKVESLLSVFLGGIEDLNPDDAGDVDDPLFDARLAQSRVQLDHVTARVDAEFGGFPLIAARIRMRLARNYQDFGELEQAEELLSWALATRLELEGEAHPDTAESKHYLGSLYIRMGRRAEAELLLEDALRTWTAALGEDHVEVQKTRNSLGTLKYLGGELDEAERWWSLALPVLESEYGLEHKETLMLLGNLGILRGEQGRNEEAEVLLKDVLERREQVLGVDHPHTVKGRTALALVYERLDRPAEALELQKRAVQSIVTRYGDDHPEALNSRVGLAFRYVDADRRDEAVALMRDVLERRRRVLGPDHRDTLMTMNSLGVMLRRCGRYSEALEILYEAHGHIVVGQGAKSQDALTSKAGLGRLLLELGRLAEAEPYLLDALAGRQELLPEEHLHVLLSTGALARLYRTMGRFDDAEVLSERAVELALRSHGPDQVITLDARVGLAVLRRFQGRLSEARDILVDVIDTASAISQFSESGLLSYRQALALVDLEAGHAEAALEVAQELWDARSGGADYPGSLRAELLLLECKVALDQHEEADVGLRNLLDRVRGLVGEEHPTTLRTLSALAELRVSEGRWSEARAYASRLCQLTDENDHEYRGRLDLLADIERRLER